MYNRIINIKNINQTSSLATSTNLAEGLLIWILWVSRLEPKAKYIKVLSSLLDSATVSGDTQLSILFSKSPYLNYKMFLKKIEDVIDTYIF